MTGQKTKVLCPLGNDCYLGPFDQMAANGPKWDLTQGGR